MQIVIKISEKDFENIATYGQCDKTEIMYAITHGIPLPEGHGRLIDADSLQKKYCDDNCGARKCVDAMDRCVFIDAVLYTPTIIEADKEGENGD